MLLNAQERVISDFDSLGQAVCFAIGRDQGQGQQASRLGAGWVHTSDRDGVRKDQAEQSIDRATRLGLGDWEPRVAKKASRRGHR